MVGPRQIVSAPAFTPLPYGLFSVVSRPTPGDTHWQNGVTYITECENTGATTYDECIAVTGSGDVPAPNVKTSNSGMTFRGATPFTVYTEFDCSPVGVDDARRIASDALDRTSSWQVERAFWTGLVDGKTIAFPHLAANAQVTDPQQPDIILQTAATIPATGTFDIACGLGIIEQELAECYNGVGVIHVPRTVIPTMQAWNLVEVRDDQLVTKNGNLVAAGGGYPGTGVTGNAVANACQSWIFATGAVFMYQSGVRINNVRDSIDRAENTVKMIAERTYVLGWDCCHLALPIDLGVPV